ncbi:hypothetical protein DXA96_03635 [Lachnospiraceae bacterium OF09-33XD]|nr:hypothetical protein DXA96_03635 [Lachnospiraceae bacterium OF09-33XD]
MELNLTNPAGNEIRNLAGADIDVDLGDTNDFVVTISARDWQGDVEKNCRVFQPGTEYGGLVGGIETDTSEDAVMVKGYTWRGLLDKKIVEPPAGQDYRVVSGELHTIMKSLVEPEFPELMRVSVVNTEVSVSSYQFPRYCTLLDGLSRLLSSVGYRLKICYVQQEQGMRGYVEISAVPVVDYSDQIELSSDSRLDYTAETTWNGVNHLICLGSGELKDRIVFHLYVQEDNSIGKTQYYAGIDEVAEIYENTNAEAEDLEEGGRDYLEKLMGKQVFKMDVAALGMEVDIGDIVGGRDYITGIYIKKPISGKIWKYKDGEESLEYKIEGEKS